MVRKIVRTVEPDALKNAFIIEHDLGPDVIVQVHGVEGRVLRSNIDVTPHSVILNFKAGVTERLKVVIIG